MYRKELTKYITFDHIEPNPKISYKPNLKPEEVPLKGKYDHEFIQIESYIYFWNSKTQKWAMCT